MAGYTAYYSNSLEKLSALYSEAIFKVRLFDNNSIIIVQNRNMEEWLKFEIAARKGLCSGISFMFQEQAVRYILNLFPDITSFLEKKTIVYLDDLKIIIYRELESILASVEKYPDFTGLKKYIDDISVSGGGNPGDTGTDSSHSFIRGERLFYLSDSIAGLFYHYGLNCAEMTASWEQGSSFLDNPDYSYLVRHEKWQRILWKMIFSHESGYIHPGQIISGILAGKYAVPEINMNIAIFGSSFLTEQTVSFFQYLSSAANVAVDHFILSPSPSCSTNESQASGKSAASSLSAAERWSTLVRDLSRLLSEKEITVKEFYETPSSSTLLGHLKAIIFSNQIYPVPEITAADNSLQIVSAPGRKREIEILKNNILRLVSSEKLKFHEIGVAAPDINLYLPFIESIFPSTDELLDIPYNVMDISFAMQSQYVKGFLSLAELCGARFTRKELFTLFTNPCFMERFELDEKDVGEWLDICGELLIKWGIDSPHRKDLLSYSDKSGTWSAGFERIASGLVFDESEGDMVIAGKEPVLPYSLSDSTSEKKISLMFAASESLYRDLYNIKKAQMGLTEWTSFFESIMDRYLKPVPGFLHEKDKSFLKDIFRQINNLAGGKETGAPEYRLPFSVFKALLDEYSSAGGYFKGQYLSSGVCFSSIKPLRAIPFRAIFLIGMDINAFPGKDNPPGYDLRNVTEKSIDLTKQNTDSFAFLETIISAKEKLYISYNGMDAAEGTMEEPSVLVTEIEDMIGKSASEQITVTHPLQSYDQACFDGNSDNILSYDSNNYLPAICLSSVLTGGRINNPYYPVFVKKQDGETAAGPGNLVSRPVEGTDIYSLIQFLKTPLSHYIGKRLGLSNNQLSMAENETAEIIGIPWFEQFNITDEISKISEKTSFDDFIDCALQSRILESRASDIPATRVEYNLLKAGTVDFYNNLEKSGYFNRAKVKITLGRGRSLEKNDEVLSLSFPSAVLEGEKGVLEVSGNIAELRYSGYDYFSVINGKFRLKNIAGHLLNYILLKKIYGKNSSVTYSVFDLTGTKKGEFSSANVDSVMAECAVADAFISSAETPYVVDPECIEYGIKYYKKEGSSDEAIEAMKNYYKNNSFSDMKYLKGFENTSPWFDDEYFRKLLENFYSCLLF